MLLQLLRAFLTLKEHQIINGQLNGAIESLAERVRQASELQPNTLKMLLEEDRRFRTEENATKVETGFLGLLWASIAFAAAVGSYAAKHVPRLTIESGLSLVTGSWLALALSSLGFVALNLLFAIRLTCQYAESKSDRSYKMHAVSLIVGFFLFVACGCVLYFAGAKE